MKFVWRLPESVLAVENRVRPGRRRCFVCTAPSAAAVARESCTFLDPAAVQNCRFFGEKSEKWWQSGGIYWGPLTVQKTEDEEGQLIQDCELKTGNISTASVFIL